ncbi:KTSC domain-containing protein [Pseudalkalibacillus caeni]|uniref:KTSC domain-containing protein n=1 Tax=Exobacillus caeni TaxID=2574798 RepID=A0A5R9F7B0_9BACL|nr:KTSC domain-containing protein [Pseudalkalibacillus caeni]TLS38150.1 KTSC domain-containing protein [Pseudalkalibacillus caeni]
MKFTTFNKKMWNLSLFDRIGYDHRLKILRIEFLNGRKVEFDEVNEHTVFHLVVAPNKEKFYYDFIKNVFSGRTIES